MRDYLGKLHHAIPDSPLFDDCPRDYEESQECMSCSLADASRPEQALNPGPTRCDRHAHRQNRVCFEIDGRLSYLKLPSHHWLGEDGRNSDGKYVNALGREIEGDGWTPQTLQEAEQSEPRITLTNTTPASTAWLEAIGLQSNVPDYSA